MDFLGRLQGDEARFREEFDVLGRHLDNARKKYDEADRRLSRFEVKLLAVADDDHEPNSLPPGPD